MFEKEAEEAFNEWKSEQYKDQSTEEKMEFVEHLHYFQKHFEKTFKAGYNKANEWHYVKDGDLPKDEEFKWCISDIGNPYVARWSEILNCWEGTMCQEVCCPYAWKEIVLPELKESE